MALRNVSIPSGAATTRVAGPGVLLSALVTTVGTGTGNVVGVDGFTASDLAVDGTDTTKVTSSSHSFVAADVGKALQITAGTGFTVGVYRIASVAANAAFLERPAGTASSSSGTYNVGPGVAVFQIVNTLAVNTLTALNPKGVPFGAAGLYVANVANGPVLTLTYDA